MKKHSALFALASLAMAWAGSAVASGCMRLIERKVDFKPREACWFFKGSATAFTGYFREHQVLYIEANSPTWGKNAKGKREVLEWTPITLSVTGPGGLSESLNVGDEKPFRTRRAGNYRFDIAPCSVWGAEIRIKMCDERSTPNH